MEVSCPLTLAQALLAKHYPECGRQRHKARSHTGHPHDFEQITPFSEPQSYSLYNGPPQALDNSKRSKVRTFGSGPG